MIVLTLAVALARSSAAPGLAQTVEPDAGAYSQLSDAARSNGASAVRLPDPAAGPTAASAPKASHVSFLLAIRPAAGAFRVSYAAQYSGDVVLSRFVGWGYAYVILSDGTPVAVEGIESDRLDPFNGRSWTRQDEILLDVRIPAIVMKELRSKKIGLRIYRLPRSAWIRHEITLDRLMRLEEQGLAPAYDFPADQLVPELCRHASFEQCE